MILAKSDISYVFPEALGRECKNELIANFSLCGTFIFNDSQTTVTAKHKMRLAKSAVFDSWFYRKYLLGRSVKKIKYLLF